MTAMRFIVLAVASGFVPTFRAEMLGTAARANPIRRVVNMLQAMQKKVEAEGEAEEELYNKFMCYCKTSKGDLEKSIADAEAKGPETASAIEESESEKAQLEADLKAHKADRESAKKSIGDATAIREKAASEYAASNSDLLANTAAISKAVTALEKGAAGFLQKGAAQTVKKVVESWENIIDEDRQSLIAFLEDGQASKYAPQSGQITGILKQIGDEMSKQIEEETAAEEAAIKEHEGLVAAKTKEINAHTSAIETKSVRVGEVAVSVANMKNDLEDTAEALEEDKKFLAELEKGCGTKEAEWTERQKVRAEELLALSETIKLLQDDDALELFKKTLPTPGEASFVQLLTRSNTELQARALAEVRTARRVAVEQVPKLDLIALALHGKKGFEKVTQMIDEMVEVLKGEQDDDDKKVAYCLTEFDTADDKKKSLEVSASDAEKAIATAEGGIATLVDEVKALTAGIEELDKSVAEATATRKKENAEFTELMALDTQAKELLSVAKNRLAKFYAPSQYIAPPKKELTQEEKIYQSVVPAEEEPAMVQQHRRAAPPPPPETFGAYKTKSEESSGVIAMVDMLVKDLDKEMTVAETTEKDSQKDYEAMMEDAKAKRAADSKLVSEKEGVKADLEGELQTHNDAKAAAVKELAATAEYISGLHAECDWLLKHGETRKEARAGEVESLKNAKAVLAGADYSLVQVHHERHLRGRA